MKAKGFTLIELIVVIVILGILAATALPRFVDFRGDAARAATQGVAAGINSATTINFGARSISAGRVLNPNIFSGAAATICPTAGGLLQGGLPAGYSVTNTGTGNTCGTNGFVDCTVTHTATGAAISTVAICY